MTEVLSCFRAPVAILDYKSSCHDVFTAAGGIATRLLYFHPISREAFRAQHKRGSTSMSGRVRREIFPERGERRFLIDEKMARLVLAILRRHLDLTVEARSAPWVTTVYCDAPDWRLFRAAKAGTGVRMRFREYHAHRPEAAFSGSQTWLEFKPVAEFTGKTRYELPTRAIPALMRGDVRLLGHPGEPEEDLARLLAANVQPVFATLYHRAAYAASEDAVRITADRELCYHTLPLWDLRERQVVPSLLGPAFATDFGVVIEMKWLRELPRWAVTVAEFLRTYSLGEREAKFIVGTRHLQRLEPKSCPARAARATARM